MTNPPRVSSRRISPGVSAIVVTCVVMLSGALSGCSDGPSEVNDASTVAAQLARVPATTNTRRSIFVNLYGRAEDAAGVHYERNRSKDQERRRAVDLNRSGVFADVALGANIRFADQYRSLGYAPSAILSEIVAGEQPDIYDVAIGSFGEQISVGQGRVLDLAAKVKGATRPKVNGVATVRWLKDEELAPELDTPVGSVRGQAGRLAFPDDGVLAYTRTDRALRQIIDVEKAGAKSLADDDDLGQVAAQLDDEKVYSAYLTGERSKFAAIDQKTFKPVKGFLGPYRALGIGVAGTTKKPRVVIALSHDSEDAAKANLASLRDAVAQASAPSGRPYREILRQPRYSRKGSTILARFDVDRANTWYRLLLTRDPLINDR